MWAWLLVVLMFSASGATLMAHPAKTGCRGTPAARACCCGHGGMGHCFCGGQMGTPAQAASLLGCPGASDETALLRCLPLALPATPLTRSRPTQLVCAAVVVPANNPPFYAPQPVPPPPEAA